MMTDANRSKAKEISRGSTLGTGLLIGLVAALLMTLSLLLLRYAFGLATPSELIGDRIAPTLSVDTFISLLDRAGGYNHLKQLGVGSVIVGQLVVGALGGIVYAVLTANARKRDPERTARFATNRRGLTFISIFTAVLWLASLLLLWPVLGTHYHGLPPGSATLVNAAGLLISYAVYAVAVILGYGIVSSPEPLQPRAPLRQPTMRRAVLIGGVGVAFAVAVGAVLKKLYDLAAFSYDGTQYKGADVQAITPNERFYVVTKNVVDPEVARGNWRLEINGLVEGPQVYRYEDLAALPAVTQQTTLRCISNEVGGGLMSNAVWKGIPLRHLIERAGPQAGVVEVFLHGVDNYSDSFAFEKAMEETTLVAYEMNGAPLPQRHGYPVRVIVPGLFGEKNVKWVTRIELVNRDVKGFYEQQGWGPNFVIPTSSRFDVPEDKKKIKLATVGEGLMLKGVAHAGDRGVSRVEVSFDDGKTWRDARIDNFQSPLAWVLWSYDWRPTQSGEYKLVVRATDGKGEMQTEKQRGTVPEGATGYHRITTQIEA